MTDFAEVMKSAALEYITNNSGNVNYVDINHHFKVHDALIATTCLIDEGKVRRVWNGRRYVFEVV